MIDRRTLIAGSAAGLALGTLGRPARATQHSFGETRIIPSSGTEIPVIGLGSWITFNVGDAPELLRDRAQVVAAFVDEGGGMIDSSPMYGSSQQTIGHALRALDHPANVFHTDKIWTSSVPDGPAQVAESARRWGIARFDLLQIHNLRAWRGHLDTLLAMKDSGEVGFIGITTSHGRRHDLLEEIMRQHSIDFVQLTYNALDRAPEDTLLPLARDRGIGVIVNRPFQGGSLVRRLSRFELPSFASEIGARSWAQILLQHIVSHPAVTVAIPATTRIDHVVENKAVGRLETLDPTLRRRVAEHIRTL